MDPELWAAIVALAASAYFAACNIALKIYSRSRLTEQLEADGKPEVFARFVDRVPHLQLLTAVIRSCLNLAVLLLILVFADRHYDDEWDLVVRYACAFAVTALAVILFGIAIPWSVTRYHSEGLLARSLWFLSLLERVTRPLVSVLRAVDPVIRRISGAERIDASEDDVSDSVMTVVQDHEAQGMVDSAQKQMIEAVFELTDTTAGQIMTPRIEVTGIEVTASLDEVKQTILREGHSRIPVYEGDLDHIAGILYAKDLLQFLGNGDGIAFDLRRILRAALMVPESKWVRQLLGEFRSRKVHIAIVLDEYGGTAGLVTIEDILEELVGEIRDEYEPTGEQEPQITRINETTFDVDARVHVDDLNDDLNIKLPEDEDYDTVGGFVFSTLGHVPDVGEKFEFANVVFTVTAAERTRVNRVRLKIVEAASDAQPDSPSQAV